MEDHDVARPVVEVEARFGIRPLILETAKESYLLSPSISGSEKMYDISLILEAEVVVEEEVPVDSGRDGTPVPVPFPHPALIPDSESASGESDDERTTKPVRRLTATTSPVHSPEPSSSDIVHTDADAADGTTIVDAESAIVGSSSVVGGGGGPHFGLQVLQRNLTWGMFRFEDEGVYVLDPQAGGAGTGAGGLGMETEWVIQVKSWKWAP